MAEVKDDDDDRHQPIRAAEFAATLNGDNPQAIRKVLRQFVSTVKRERRLALSIWSEDGDGEGEDPSGKDDADEEDAFSDDDDDMSSNSKAEIENNMDEVQPPPTKKYKKSEEWKKDTASYHVPFVGTAVAKGEVAPVRKDEWPTGLLRAYLEKSPMATELFNGDLRPPSGQIHRSLLKKRQGKLSRAICKAHLHALAELLTVAVPKEKIRRNLLPLQTTTTTSFPQRENATDSIADPTWTKFLSNFTNEILPWMFAILNEETGNGRGKLDEKGGCGSLVGPAMKILQCTALISTSQARSICRQLDESLSDGVLRLCLRSKLCGKGNEPKAEIPKELSSAHRDTKSLGSEAIKLATILLQSNDPVVHTYICTGGSRERKIKAGVVYLALREGIETPSQNHASAAALDADDSYLAAVGNMLEAIHLAIFGRSSKVGNNRSMVDLFSKDAVQALTRLVSYAPRLEGEISYQEVLDSIDHYDGAKAFQKAAIQARRLLFRLLSDRTLSPLLYRGDWRLASSSLVHLLESMNTSQSLRRFVIFAMSTSPLIVNHFFRILDVFDSNSSFQCVSRMALVNVILLHGPSALECLSGDCSRDTQWTEDDMFHVLFPAKVKGQTLMKALQKGNSIVRMETLKLIIMVVGRFKRFLRESSNGIESNTETLSTVALRLTGQLPDFRTLLTLYNKVDRTKASGAFLAIMYLRALEAIASLSRDLSEEVFDPWKALPMDAIDFHSLLPGLQMKSLRFVQTICTSDCQPNELLSSRTVFEIMLTTHRSDVHTLCREIVTMLLNRYISRNESDQELCQNLEQEANVWITSITYETIPVFFKLLERISTDGSWNVMACVGRAWKKHSKRRREMHFSILMAAALSDTSLSSFGFRLVGQIVARCIFYLRDPLPLSEVVVSLLGGEDLSSYHPTLRPLLEYAQMVVNFNGGSPKKLAACVKHLLRAFFSKDSVYITIFEALRCSDNVGVQRLQSTMWKQWGRSMTIPTIRYIQHLFVILFNRHKMLDRFTTLLWCLHPLMSLASPQSHKERSLAALIYHDIVMIQTEYGVDQPSLIQVAVDSLGRNTSTLDPESSPSEALIHEWSLHNKTGRVNVLYCFLLGGSSSLNDRMETAKSLLQECGDRFSERGILSSSVFLQDIFCQTEGDHIRADLWEQIVDCWMTASKRAGPKHRAESLKIKSVLSSLLCQRLRAGRLSGAVVQMLVGSNEVESVIDVCLESLIDKLPSLADLDMLVALVRSDGRYCSSLASRFLKNDFDLSKAWEAGYLDELFGSVASSLTSKETKEALMKYLLPRVTVRAQAALPITKDMDLRNLNRLVELACCVLTISSFDQEDYSDLCDAVDSILVQLFISRRATFLRISAVGNICRTMRVLVARPSMNTRRHQLLPDVFTFLFVSLPSAMKTKPTKQDSVGLSTSDALSILIDLLRQYGVLAEGDTRKLLDSNSILKTSRACLKHGISMSHLEHDTPRLAIQLLKEIVSLSTKKGSSEAWIAPAPGDIFKMATSHSKFVELFVEQLDIDRTSALREMREAVVELLISCIKASSEPVDIAPSIWQAILGDFGGAFCDIDKPIVRLVEACPLDIRPPMTCAHSHGWNDEDLLEESFEWFVRDISLGRIRSTILNFHSLTTPDFDPDNSQEPRRILLEEFVIKPSKAPYHLSNFLTLLLGTLEQCFVGTTGSKLPMEFSTGTAATVHRLCDKGIVSLCFMCLSSASEKVRLYAVSALGIILQVIVTEDAIGESSWRNRPQLQMILDSVQRGLLLEKTNQPEIVVPQLLPVVALFLARAASVLQRPDDPLYIAINRYFLKSEMSHGCFQDFHRLPCFVSLICSESGDINQARTERLWALQNICDGLTDEESFRLAASCHGPDLILTSFENARTLPVSDELKSGEYCLILQALKAMIARGGHTAHNHLLRRGGLLPWMSSVCHRTPHSQCFFPTYKSFIAFCDLLKAVMDVLSSSDSLRVSTTSTEVCSLIEPLLLVPTWFTLDTQHITMVVQSTLASLHGISKVLLILRKDGLIVDYAQHLGASLTSAENLLNLVGEKEQHKLKALNVLCSLPVSLARIPSSETVMSFVSRVIECCKIYVATFGEARAALDGTDSECYLSLALRRVLLLLEYQASLEESLKNTDKQLVLELFAFRSNLSLCSLGTDVVWAKCLKLLLVSSCGTLAKNDDQLLAFISKHVFV